MKRNIFFSLAGAAALLGMTGCGSAPVRIDTASSQGITTVHQIDFKDWQIAAEKGISTMRRQPCRSQNMRSPDRAAVS